MSLDKKIDFSEHNLHPKLKYKCRMVLVWPLRDKLLIYQITLNNYKVANIALILKSYETDNHR